jgi:hypothetical protein
MGDRVDRARGLARIAANADLRIDEMLLLEFRRGHIVSHCAAFPSIRLLIRSPLASRDYV